MSTNQPGTASVAPTRGNAEELNKKLKACKTWAEEKQLLLDTESGSPMEMSLLKMSGSKEEWFRLLADWSNFSRNYAKAKREGAKTPAGIQWLLDNNITINPPTSMQEANCKNDRHDQLQK
ncbi:hypothetical protein AAVH_34611 [Aphelenchoides avenae]|nr:hypothetical protein AAVH_34611 [Aphelenchus avenae]